MCVKPAKRFVSVCSTGCLKSELLIYKWVSQLWEQHWHQASTLAWPTVHTPTLILGGSYTVESLLRLTARHHRFHFNFDLSILEQACRQVYAVARASLDAMVVLQSFVLFLSALLLCLSPALAASTGELLSNILHHGSQVNSVSALQPGQLNYFNLSRPEGTREFWLYVPSNYFTLSAPAAYPLALYFHGYGIGPPLQNGYHQGIYLNFTADAEKAGYLIAFPNGTPSQQGYLSWNAGRCCKSFNSSMVYVDDVAFTRAMVKTIEANARVDPTRRYAMGWSNGGMMTERLACEAPELWAGIAADASGVVLGDTVEEGHAMCDASFNGSSLNYFYLKGTADPTLPWTGTAVGNPNGWPSALDDIARWSQRLGCSSLVKSTYNDGEFSNLVWPQCRNGTQIEFMTVRNGVHQWWTLYNDPGFRFETTKYVLAFFDRTHQSKNSSTAPAA